MPLKMGVGGEPNKNNAPRVDSANPNSIPNTFTSKQSAPPEFEYSHRLADISADPSLPYAEESADRVRFEYDVYATPFVPASLQEINLQQATVVSTPSRHVIASDTYVSSFAGKSFVPNRNRVYERRDDHHDSTSPDIPLTSSNYETQLRTLLNVEHAAKTIENSRYALYRVPLFQFLTPGSGELWTLNVPGIREESPWVESGDILQIRQLYTDVNGTLVNLPMQPQSQYSSYYPPHLSQWAGVQHDASVQSVNRATEVVHLKVDGLRQIYNNMVPMPVFVNVVFPPKERWRTTQPDTLAYVSRALNDIGLARSPIGTANVNKGEGSNGETWADPWIRKMLFPEVADGVLQTTLRRYPSRGYFDPKVNYEQAHAIQDICNNKYGTLPYLISGPPGTGKTKTLVELAKQLLNSTNVAHILICAPSEPAADTLALRLKEHLPPKSLLRLNRPGRAYLEVPQALMQYTYTQHDMFYLPPFQQLMKYNVVVASCQDVSMLFQARLTNSDLWLIEKDTLSAFHPESTLSPPPLHWGALLIDEAAQATEVDLLPALSVVMPDNSVPKDIQMPLLAMAGDEHQLGPRTASRDPRLSTSLFARLFDRPLYKSHPLSRSSVRPSTAPPVLTKEMLPMAFPPFTNLVRNYRSHPAILSVPSTLFYNDTLIPEAAIPSTPLQSSSLWRGRKWPVLFIPHVGSDEIERDGGGWYNKTEAQLACDLAQRLVTESRVAQPDICIMSPFAAQVKVLRSIIRSSKYGSGAGLWEVNIGPLEAFQGLEKRVVIICTTRTRERFLNVDVERGLGLVHQKRKMNVSVTRAMEGLFVVGSPDILAQDEHWKAFLAFCVRNGLVEPGHLAGKLENLLAEQDRRVGVLEKALLAKTKRMERTSENPGRVLGGRAAVEGVDTEEYETWIEDLRAAIEGEDVLQEEAKEYEEA